MVANDRWAMIHISLATVFGLACAGCSNGSTSRTEEPSTASQAAPEPAPATAPQARPQTADPVATTGPAASPLERISRSPHTSFSQITDGTVNTILVGTVSAERSVPWTKPDDIRLDDSFQTPGNAFEEGYFASADGAVRYIHIEDDLDAAGFRGLFTIGGAEPHSIATLYPQDHKFTFPTYDSPEEQLKHIKAGTKYSNALKQIALALHNYHATYNHLPPAVVDGPEGKPMHSWRVLILPFLGQAELYGKYDLSLPWDHPDNAAVLAEIPEVYRDPLSDDDGDTRTPYLVISGSGTAFPVAADASGQ